MGGKRRRWAWWCSRQMRWKWQCVKAFAAIRKKMKQFAREFSSRRSPLWLDLKGSLELSIMATERSIALNRGELQVASARRIDQWPPADNNHRQLQTLNKVASMNAKMMLLFPFKVRFAQTIRIRWNECCNRLAWDLRARYNRAMKI